MLEGKGGQWGACSLSLLGLIEATDIKVTKTELVVEQAGPENRNRTKTRKKTGSQNWSTKNTKTT